MSLWSKLMLKPGGINPVLESSRTTGVAPLGIVFDGVSNGLSQSLEWTYFFDFGDAACSNYTSGNLAGQTRNKFVGGPVAAFVYETPGTYTARMWAYDGTSIYGPVSKTITVSDPDVVYAGALTTVISTTGNFAGAPAGSTQVTATEIKAHLDTYLVNGKRVLLRSGESFTCTGSRAIGNLTDAYLGSFASGASPIVTQQTAATITLQLSGKPQRNVVTNIDARITGTISDFVQQTVTADTAAAPPVLPVYSAGYLTMHKCTVTKHMGARLTGGNGNVVSRQVQVDVNGGTAIGGSTAIYMEAANSCAIVDCDLNNLSGGEHVVRVQGFYKFIALSNKFSRCAVSKHFISLRGYQSLSAPGCNAQFGQISGCHVDGSPSPVSTVAAMMTVTPQNGTAYEPISHCVIENNFIVAPVNCTQQLGITANTTVVRSNVFYIPSTNNEDTISIAVSNGNTGIGLSAGNDVRVVNNTMYSAQTAAGFGFSAVRFATTSSDCKAYANVAYAPNVTQHGDNFGSAPTFLAPSSVSAIYTLTDNSSDGQIKSTNPLFNGAGSAFIDYKLQTGSPYVNFSATNRAIYVDAAGYLSGALPRDTGAMNNTNKQTGAWTIIP